MSTALAIGAVSAVLRNVLDNGLIDAVPAVGSPVKVSAKAPDLIKLDDPQEGPQLNLFLYRVSLNPAYRNMDLPTRDSGGRRVANPPLAVDLHYLLTAYAREDLHAEILLGYGMHLLHERPFLDRAAIRKALELSPLDPTVLPGPFQAPANAGLADQFETLKVTWEPLDFDGMSKIWSAVQKNYRPSAAYQVSVVLIQGVEPAADPLPVLTRRLVVEPSTVPPLPAVEQATAPDGTNIAELGETITLHGHHLAGTAAKVTLGHRLLAAPHEIAVGANPSATELTFALPAAESAGQIWPAGVWNISVTLIPAGEAQPRTTNAAALLLAPVPGASVITRDAVTRRVSAQVDVTPQVRPEQTATVALDSAQATAGFRTLPAGQVDAEFAPIPAGSATLRLRVDGVDSRFIDYSGPVPVFRADRQVTVP
ncbi:DUF4255 domain-containing protein [Catellatospora vulcania]|uniref:DUF4255 domain-containing protein n=1 Tax=Catellatospora vulcania TaxID=1460450 RepID=UPI0012D41A41|nr:DUF4255 domain-containing protein [Catellatospora vulcania]